MTTTHTLETADVDLVYDVHGPLPTADGRRPLLMVGQPMDAGGFGTLASYFPDRTVVTYDPRGLGRSTRKDGRVDHTPQDQAADLHALIAALDAGPIDMFASSGGAVTALELVTRHPEDVAILVAHEPPMNTVLPDAEAADRARQSMFDAYTAGGFGAGMAQFIAMTSWPGEFTEDFFAQPPADPAMFGMSSDDDGSRDDPLLSDRSWAITDYELDADALRAAPTRIVIGVGVETGDTYTGRTARGDRIPARPGGDRVPEPSRWVPRRRARLRRRARGVRRHAARGARRRSVTARRERGPFRTAPLAQIPNSSRMRSHVDRIREELRKADGRIARAERAPVELDVLVDHLAAALGLGGRARQQGGTAVRARSAITHRIRATIRRLGDVHPALGRHLDAAVRTGLYCSYRPEVPTTWRT